MAPAPAGTPSDNAATSMGRYAVLTRLLRTLRL